MSTAAEPTVRHFEARLRFRLILHRTSNENVRDGCRWREIQKLAEKKPVVASMGDVAGSGTTSTSPNAQPNGVSQMSLSLQTTFLIRMLMTCCRMMLSSVRSETSQALAGMCSNLFASFAVVSHGNKMDDGHYEPRTTQDHVGRCVRLGSALSTVWLDEEPWPPDAFQQTDRQSANIQAASPAKVHANMLLIALSLVGDELCQSWEMLYDGTAHMPTGIVHMQAATI